MSERISRKNDRRCYQPRLHSDRVKELYDLGQTVNQPITYLQDLAVRKFVREYDKDMETLESMMERLGNSVEYLTIQKVEDGWFMSFVDTEARELQNSNYRDLILNAISLVFPSSSSTTPSTVEYPAPPSPENQ